MVVQATRPERSPLPQAVFRILQTGVLIQSTLVFVLPDSRSRTGNPKSSATCLISAARYNMSVLSGYGTPVSGF